MFFCFSVLYINLLLKINFNKFFNFFYKKKQKKMRLMHSTKFPIVSIKQQRITFASLFILVATPLIHRSLSDLSEEGFFIIMIFVIIIIVIVVSSSIIFIIIIIIVSY
jgi:hypothetical protein